MSNKDYSQSKTCNLFIVGTPYQLITALNIILDYYSSKEFENQIFIELSKGKRFNPDVREKYENINFKKVNGEDWVNQILELTKWKPNNFYFFQEASILNKYLSYHFKKHGALIHLGPDGTKAYGLFNKSHEFLSMLKDTFNDYKFLIQNRIFFPKLFWSKNYKYGSFKLLDKIWVPFLEIFDAKHNQSKGAIKKLPDLTAENLSRIAKILRIELNSEFDGNQALIYFNQPFWSESLVKKDIEILLELTKKINWKKFYIKLHPSTKNEIIDRYLNIPGITIIKDEVPAEFYIASSENSILITGWSTCLMHPIKESNKYYYLYPIFKQIGDKILNQINLISFPHVEMVSDLNEIKFLSNSVKLNEERN